MSFFQKKSVLLPALLTPFDGQGEINYGALERLTERVIGEGADGLYACGSTAEVYLMDHEERKSVLEAIMRFAAGRVPVIAQVGSTSQREACLLARHAADAGAVAISSVPPFYYNYSMAELQAYYFAVADACGLPVLVYNIPEFTGVTFTFDNAAELLSDPRILGIKHTDYNLYTLGQIKRNLPGKLILNGHEECMVGALTMGADGGIGSTFNVLGPLFCQLRDMYNAGDYEGAMAAQMRVNALIAKLSAAGGFKAIKYMVKLQGIDCGACRRPYAPIDAAGRKLVEEILADMT